MVTHCFLKKKLNKNPGDSWAFLAWYVLLSIGRGSIMDKKAHENSPLRDNSGGLVSSLNGAGASESTAAYFKEARLFLGKDRATLTFYVDQEVASIHYDLLRDEIFYKGHNVKNMTMTQGQWVSLKKFSEYLAEDPRAERLNEAYRACLEHLMTDHGLPA